MNEEFEFQKWGSISRLFRPILITEKIDGTNAQVNIIPEELMWGLVEDEEEQYAVKYEGDYVWGESELGKFGIFAGSRKRYVNKQNDNFGFANWVWNNADELAKLGPGRHYGEWWGSKIQRGYGIGEKRFSLFNVMRYALDPSMIPRCCRVVPLMYAGPMDQYAILDMLQLLERDGSLAEPGFNNPEGIVILHTHSNTLFKVTLEGDQHKSEVMEEKMEVLNENIV